MKHNDAQIFLFFLNLIAVAIVVQIQNTKERAGIFLTKGNTTRHVFSFENAYVLCVFGLCAHLNNRSGGFFIEFYGKGELWRSILLCGRAKTNGFEIAENLTTHA